MGHAVVLHAGTEVVLDVVANVRIVWIVLTNHLLMKIIKIKKEGFAKLNYIRKMLT